MAKTPLIYTHIGNRTTIAISASFNTLAGPIRGIKCRRRPESTSSASSASSTFSPSKKNALGHTFFDNESFEPTGIVPSAELNAKMTSVARDSAPVSSAKALDDLEGLSEPFSNTMKIFEGLSLEERLAPLRL